MRTLPEPEAADEVEPEDSEPLDESDGEDTPDDVSDADSERSDATPDEEDEESADDDSEDAEPQSTVDGEPDREDEDGEEGEEEVSDAVEPAESAEPELTAGPEPEPEPDTETAPEAEAASEPTADPDPDPDPDPEPKVASHTEPKPKTLNLGTKLAAALEPKPERSPEPDAAEPKPDEKPQQQDERAREPEKSPLIDMRKPATAPDAPALPPKPTSPPPAPPAAPSPQPDRVERTKQQPLPPDPDEPLRLLAQLTNTPPPPETLLRTIVRRIKIWTPLALFLVIVIGVAQLLRPLPEPSLELTAATSYSFNGKAPDMPWPSDGQAAIKVDGLGSFGSRGGDKPVPIASVTKIMTAYVILRDHPLKKGRPGPKITVDRQAQADYQSGLKANESVVKVQAGQKLTEYEALQGLMIPSANNVARLLGRWDAGSAKAFAKKMNAAAKQLGMTHTTYTDPSGLDATTVSTANDQVKLAQATMRDPVFREIAGTAQYRPTGYDQPVFNSNNALNKNGVIGVKTGSSTAAGGNLVFAAEKEVSGTKQLIVGAVLGQRGTPMLQSAINGANALITTVQDALTSTKLFKKGEVIGHVDDGLGGTTPVAATKDVVAVGWPGLKVTLGMVAANGAVPHKAAARDKVGSVTVGGGTGQVKVPVALQADLEEPSFGSRLIRIL